MRRLFLSSLMATAVLFCGMLSMFVTFASANSRPYTSSPYSAFVPLPEDYPWGYTIASNNSVSFPIDGVMGKGAAFGDNTAAIRDPVTNTITLVDQVFFIARQLLMGDGNTPVGNIPASEKQVVTIAGVVNDYGFRNGPRMQAKFDQPCSIVSFGSKFVIADMGNNCLRAMSNVRPSFSDVSTFAGTCSPSSSIFMRPTSLDTTDTYIYVADQLNYALRKVDANGAVSLVVQQVDWKPTFIAVLNDQLAVVIGSDQELWTVDMTTGAITNTNFKTSAIAAALIQPDIDKATRTFYFVAQHADAALTQSIYGLDLDTMVFTSYISYVSGTADGHNPTFRDVTALQVISPYELLVIQRLSVRGLFVRPPPFTRTITAEVRPSRTLTETVLSYIFIPIYFLTSTFVPMTNTTALATAKALLVEDINGCLAAAAIDEEVYGATDFDYVPTTSDRIVFSNTSYRSSLPMPRGEQVVLGCNYTRLKQFLNDEFGVVPCRVDRADVLSNGADIRDDYCTNKGGDGDDGDRIFTCDDNCIVAATVSSVGFVAISAAVVAMALTASTKSAMVSAFLLIPGGF